MRGDYAAVGARAVEAVEHSVGFAGNAGDGVGAFAFVAEITGHSADDVGTRAGEDEAAIVADAFEFAGLIGDAKIFGEKPREVTFLVNGKKIEKVFGELFVEDFASVEGFEELRHLVGR